jgi:hypothetical protein
MDISLLLSPTSPPKGETNTESAPASGQYDQPDRPSSVIPEESSSSQIEESPNHRDTAAESSECGSRDIDTIDNDTTDDEASHDLGEGLDSPFAHLWQYPFRLSAIPHDDTEYARIEAEAHGWALSAGDERSSADSSKDPDQFNPQLAQAELSLLEVPTEEAEALVLRFNLNRSWRTRPRAVFDEIEMRLRRLGLRQIQWPQEDPRWWRGGPRAKALEGKIWELMHEVLMAHG